MAFITDSRSPLSTRTTKASPSSSTAAMPTCQGTCACCAPTIENDTMALSPMPEARASGRLVTRPMVMHMTAAPRAVAVAAPAKGTPAAARMPGFTNTM